MSRATNRLKGSFQDASDDLEAQMDDIKDDFGRLRETLSQVLSKSGSIVSSQLAVAREQVKDKAGGWLQTGQEVASQTLERAREHEADFEEVVQLHPIVSVAAAIGIGLVIGTLLMSGSRR